jgi:hypothetical protein
MEVVARVVEDRPDTGCGPFPPQVHPQSPVAAPDVLEDVGTVGAHALTDHGEDLGRDGRPSLTDQPGERVAQRRRDGLPTGVGSPHTHQPSADPGAS